MSEEKTRLVPSPLPLRLFLGRAERVDDFGLKEHHFLTDGTAVDTLLVHFGV